MNLKFRIYFFPITSPQRCTELVEVSPVRNHQSPITNHQSPITSHHVYQSS
ncbi:MAG: hypothetical protein ACKPBB_15660 [Sphaerospermopsis kisseleviana]